MGVPVEIGNTDCSAQLSQYLSPWTTLRQPGQQYDEETDLIENWNRYYRGLKLKRQLHTLSGLNAFPPRLPLLPRGGRSGARPSSEISATINAVLAEIRRHSGSGTVARVAIAAHKGSQGPPRFCGRRR